MSDQIELRCPHCACRDRIDIAANVWVRVTEDGSDADESHDGTHHWTDESAAYCCACGHPGFVDGELKRLDSLTGQREREFAFFNSENFPRLLTDHGVALAIPASD